ncbi:unnamed protein product, partial [Effrenium voratum]
MLRWDKHRAVSPDRWGPVHALIDQLPQAPVALSPAITSEIFIGEVRRKKCTAATGPDGLARSDILQMPHGVVDGLVSICHQAEQSGTWPQQVITGIVSSLQKGTSAARVADYRLITIYSLVYRTWSSIRCALSCAAMVLVDILFEVAINLQVPRATPLSYVDNWAVQADKASDVSAAYQ